MHEQSESRVFIYNADHHLGTTAAVDPPWHAEASKQAKPRARPGPSAVLPPPPARDTAALATSSGPASSPVGLPLAPLTPAT